MAGGKETPRQKMIGMMYLVLTALLALNVSKSILDAFVAIEENMQKANQTELFRGNEKRSELKETASDNSNPERAKKATILLKAVEDIDKMAAKRIKEIDELKLEILEACGEDVTSVGKTECIIVEKYDEKNTPLKPARMNLQFVNGKDKYDDPMRIMIGDATDLKNPKGKGLELWNSLIDLRSEITEKIASTHVFIQEGGKASLDNKYSFKAPKINTFKDQPDLNKQIKKSIQSQNVHPDDEEVILEIYRGLTKQERNETAEIKDVHWIGKTFDHSPSVAAIASLTSLQKDVLAARAQAIALIRNRVGGGEFSFNKILGLAYGPEVVNVNDEFTLEVLMAAYDSDIKPEVTYDGVNVKDIRNGKGYIKLKGTGSSMELSGTVSILNKSGIKKTMPWKKRITVMKPAGSIEMPEYNYLYRGYPNQVNATASGFPETSVVVSNGTKKSNGQGGFTVSPGRGSSASITVYGVSADGSKVKLKSIQYKVTNLPSPTLYWGSAKSGGKASSSRTLIAKYEPGMPLNAKFRIIKYQMQAGGMSGAPVTGASASLAPGNALINAARRGNQFSVVATVVGPDGIQRQVPGVWTK